ncbi:MAG: hypothetical protein HYZ57_02170 [Acidobacteria bacterium]|nr:hypothetical protein [Acidobacteriota bacterium]MBI3278628.1 hypothetical protein [Acidobacteriota bacterium]
MVGLITSVFIIVVSVALFLYWFRYSCLLILSGRGSRDYAAHVASANQLSFLEARNRLMNGGNTLDQLRDSLDRDYRLLIYLLRHAANYKVAGKPLDERMLIIDFYLMRAWYALARKFSEPLARAALLEMTSILNHLANSMGERLALSPRV